MIVYLVSLVRVDWAGCLILNLIFARVLNAGCYVMAAHSNGYGLRSCTSFRLVSIQNLAHHWRTGWCRQQLYFYCKFFSISSTLPVWFAVILLKVRVIQISVFCYSANFSNCILTSREYFVLWLACLVRKSNDRHQAIDRLVKGMLLVSLPT